MAKKITAKTGDAATQWEILKSMGLSAEEICPFVDPVYWLEYYPPLGIRDLKLLGAPLDFRRSFITTDINPYYDSFIRWQFTKLKEADKIGFGKRPTIYSEMDGQACMDHDRAEGEGVGPQEYTAIKIQLAELPPALSKLKGKTIFLLAATLRAETMVGQSNVWILPEGNYGCWDAGNKDVYITSHRAARNMSFQDILVPWGKPKLLQDVSGKDLMGAKCKAPHSPFEIVHLLPLPTIKMDKGTGVVTSVPSDSPDDYAAFMDLMKPEKRKYYGLKEEWVVPFKDFVPIIDVEIDGEIRKLAAEYMCEKLKVSGPKDTVKLLEAHDTCYKLGFDKGTMSYGPFKGKPVKVAKGEFRQQMVKEGNAFVYSEPEKKVVSRSGDECVVASIDQWFLRYGEESWKNTILEHLEGSNFNTYNDRILESFQDAIGWLKEWACSRAFGLGTRVPWDEQFLIESLSDSTIYMAYYTVAHFLQEGSLDGSKGSPVGIKPEDMTPDVWDFIFLNGPKPKKSKIKQDLLDKMRNEFRFWYPMDLRVSGKDLIQNHLTFSLYNHACVWEKEPAMWPQGFFCNGWLMVDNEKMSKSKGNFFTIKDICSLYSADTFRLACANAGDTMEDCNLELAVADKAILRLTVMLDLLQSNMKSEGLQDSKEDQRFVDRWFANEMNRLVVETKQYFDKMLYREGLRTSYFEFCAAHDLYKDVCKAGLGAPCKKLMMRYWEWQMILLSPFCPHFCDHAWGILGKKGSILDATFPAVTKPVDDKIISQGKYIFDKVPHEFIKTIDKNFKGARPTGGVVYVKKDFPVWQTIVLDRLRKAFKEHKLPLMNPDDFKKDDTAKEQWKAIMKDLTANSDLKQYGSKVGPFAGMKRDDAATGGESALDAASPFDEAALLEENIPYLKDKLRIQDLSVGHAEKAPKEHEQSASQANPGKPMMFFIGGDAGGKPAKGGSGAAPKNGPAKAGGASPPKSGAKSNWAVIKDMKQLNEHMSTRSYIEGGPGPTQADVVQYEACSMDLASKVDVPHAARWYRHIHHFTAAQRSRW